jgi:imidazole glycerol phosphate synthase glutamine amidotransferase subunit
MGNIGSIQNMLNKLGAHSIISSDPEVIEDASQLILPGVGHFQRGMERLVELNLVDLLNKKVLVDRIPSLGICLGMQLMGKLSEEGNSAGLGWFDAEFKKFDLQKTNYPIKVPCIGWNEVTLKNYSKGLINQGFILFILIMRFAINHQKFLQKRNMAINILRPTKRKISMGFNSILKKVISMVYNYFKTLLLSVNDAKASNTGTFINGQSTI